MILNSTIKNKPTTPVTTYSTEGAIDYITGKTSNNETIKDEKEIRIQLSTHEQTQLGWTQYFNELSTNGYIAYHLTVTYNELKSRSLTKNEIEKLFDQFYKHKLLKTVMGNNYSRKNKIHKLPITIAFLDEHEKLVTRLHSIKFANRCHIHAVIAAHPDTADKFEALIGTNTLKDDENKSCGLIKTTHLNKASEYCAAYASKSKSCYDDFLIYGPPEPINSLSVFH